MKRETHIQLLIFALALAIRLGYWWATGVQTGGDTLFYQQAAQTIIQADYNVLALLDEHLPFYYWLYPLFLAIFRLQPLLVVMAQILLGALTAVLVYRLGSVLFNRRTAVLAGVGYALLWEVFQWDVRLLSDASFIFLVVAGCYSLVVAAQTNRQRWWVASALGLGLLGFARPTALPFYGCAFFFLTAGWAVRRRWGLAIGLGAAALIAAYVTGFLEPTYNHGVHSFVGYFRSLFEQGVVVRDRPQYTLAVDWQPGLTLTNLGLFLVVLGHRLVAFWFIYSGDFHWLHKAINSLTFIPLYGLGLWGMYASLRQRTTQALSFLMSLILTYWVFQAATEVDFDWRYRLPILPFVLLLASFGADQALRTPKVAKHIWPIIRYGMAGLVSTGADFLILNLLFLGAHVSLFWSTLVGFITGGIVGYVLHSRWTFKYDTRGKQIRKLIQVLLVSAIGLALTEIIIHGLTYGLSWHHNSAKLVAVAVSAAWAFSALRWWVFPVGLSFENHKDIVAKGKG